jgi:hypothetical protein
MSTPLAPNDYFILPQAKRGPVRLMCNLYSITTKQAAIIALFRVVNRYVGNLPPMPGVFPDYPAPVVRNTDTRRELTTMRWGMPPPPKFGGPPVTDHNGGSASALEPRIP